MRRFPAIPVVVLLIVVAASIFALSRVDATKTLTRVEIQVPENALAK